jgi:hypothetical protein
VQVTENRSKGDLLGETAFFFQLRHINTATVAEGSTMLFVLSYEDYQQLGSTYVDDAAQVMELIIDLTNDTGKAGKSQGSGTSSGSHGAYCWVQHVCAHCWVQHVCACCWVQHVCVKA